MYLGNIMGANQFGDTALICAAHNGHVPIVTALLDKNANIDLVNNNGETALI